MEIPERFPRVQQYTLCQREKVWRMEAIALFPHKVDRTLPAKSSTASLPWGRNKIFLPLSSVGTSHSQGHVSSQLQQTSGQPYPGGPWHPVGASQECLETTQLVQCASLQGFCIDRVWEGARPHSQFTLGHWWLLFTPAQPPTVAAWGAPKNLWWHPEGRQMCLSVSSTQHAACCGQC